MYAIETYFIPPTNTRGARIKARVMEGRTADGGPARSITLPWNHALGTAENHAAACEALAARRIRGRRRAGGGPMIRVALVFAFGCAVMAAFAIFAAALS